MKLIVIDNYDSFTYNLVHYFEELGCKVTVKRNDEVIFSVNPGEYFGEHALLHKNPRLMSATICSDWARLIRIKDIKVREMLAEDPKIAQIFMFNMAEKLQKLL